MKTKYFLIYLGIGIAFAAVSLWVFLSRGKNAKAVWHRYPFWLDYPRRR